MQFCEKVRRQNATIIQLWSNFFANRKIYGVKDSRRLLIIRERRRRRERRGKISFRWKKGNYQASNPDSWFNIQGNILYVMFSVVTDWQVAYSTVTFSNSCIALPKFWLFFGKRSAVFIKDLQEKWDQVMHANSTKCSDRMLVQYDEQYLCYKCINSKLPCQPCSHNDQILSSLDLLRQKRKRNKLYIGTIQTFYSAA